MGHWDNTDPQPPSPQELRRQAEDNDVVEILTISPEGWWTVQEIDRELIDSKDEDDRKVAALTFIWHYQRARGWASEGRRRVDPT